MSEFITVAKVGDIPDQEGRAFEVNGAKVAVFNDDGEYQAIDDMCPHAGASLASGFYENNTVTCAWHAWKFKTTDGSFFDCPRIKTDVYRVRVIGDEIQVSKSPLPRTIDPDPNLTSDDSNRSPQGDSHRSSESSSEIPRPNHE